jgi:hypothetical protein
MPLLFQHKIIHIDIKKTLLKNISHKNMTSDQKIQGYCERCKGPVFLNNSDDQYGNTVITLNCWNGHYAWIKIEGIEQDLPNDNKIQTPKTIVKRISFFKLP